jgi:ATPase subunit of ABC transporter with duplicated ATPase domains
MMNLLVGYFFDLKNEVTKDLDRRKGLALIGPYGIGKTIAFRIVHRMLEKRYSGDPSKNLNTFRQTSIEEIITAMKAEEFRDGILFKRMQTDVGGARISQPLNILINEFGVDYEGKHFGTSYSVMLEQFLIERYDIFQQTGKLTHATMNFSIEDINEKFSPRLRDRFREMFSFVELSGQTFRK